jgi:Tol biopolymer transport system component
MSEDRSTLERELERLMPPRITFERLERRRDRKRRDQRIRAAAVGLAVAIGVTWLGVNLIRSTPSVPTVETPTPTPSPEVSIDWETVPTVTIDGDAIVDILTGEVTALPTSITAFGDPGGFAVAPGGDVLLFEASTGGSSDSQIFVANVDGTNVRQLTDAPGGATWGAWSPDGTTIVALVGEGVAKWGRRDVDLVLIKVAAGETTQLASGRGGDFWEPHFSPDGQLILFGRFTNPMGSDTFGIPVGGGDAALVVEDRWNAIFSPDGRTIVYEADAIIGIYEADARIGTLGGPQLWLADADGRDPRPLVPNDEPFSETPTWSPDGTRIVFTKHLQIGSDGLRLRPTDRLNRVAVVDVVSGVPTFSVFAPRVMAGVWLDDDTLLIDVGG